MTPKSSESEPRRPDSARTERGSREAPRAPEAERNERASHWAFLKPLWPHVSPARQEFVLA